MPTVVHQGITLAYEDRGAGQPAFVFVHGWACNRTFFAPQCQVPALHLATTPPSNPPHLLSQWLPTVVHGWTVGAGVFSQLEVPDQVNARIEGFLRHHV
jgi:pimeloyl-ACP methyl ester carboxylesterase